MYSLFRSTPVPVVPELPPNPYDAPLREAEDVAAMAEQLTQLDIYLLLELAIMQLPRFPDAMPAGFTYRLDVCSERIRGKGWW